MALVIPAAKWASAASVAGDIPHIFTLTRHPSPCVADREEAHRAMVGAGVLVARAGAGPLDLCNLSGEGKFGDVKAFRIRWQAADPASIDTYYRGAQLLPTPTHPCSPKRVSGHVRLPG